MEKDNEIKYISSAVDIEKSIQSSRYSSSKPVALTSLGRLQSILSDPQEFDNIKQLYEFCDYYINYDSICSGAIKNIFIPFSQAPYRLVGGNQRARNYFIRMFEKNNLEDVVRGCANDYHKYGNIFVYLNNDNTIQMLPPHRCFVESLSISGEPVVSFEIDKVQKRGKTKMDDIERKYAGYPKEVVDAAKKGESYARLEIGKIFSCSYAKASWEKYATPPLTSALPWLLQKETLNRTLVSEFDNMRATFLHVKIGDKEKNAIPANEELNAVGNVFRSTLVREGHRIVPTSWNVESEFKNGGTKDSLETINEVMTNINWNILSSLSLSSVLATGETLPNTSSSTNFSTINATVSLVNKRINAFLFDISKMINKIIEVVSLQEGFKSFPKLQFELVDLNKKDGVNELILQLYDKGFISKETVYEHTNFSYEEEIEKRKLEKENGVEDVLIPPQQPYNMKNEGAGRPEKDLEDRRTDIDGKNENPRKEE